MSAESLPAANPREYPILTLVDPDVPASELSVDELGSRIVGLSGRLAAAMCRWLLLVADFDAREGAARFGLPTTARWLSLTCGIARRTAIEQVRVARALAAYPVLAAAMQAGRLSYSHVRAVTRAARDDDPDLVADLVEMAEHSAVGQLETMVRGLRTVERNEADRGPDEYFGHDWTGECQWRCHARLDPERGAVVQSALETVVRANRISLAEALVRVCEAALTAAHDSADPPRPLRGHERAAILIHLDTEAVPLPPARVAPSAVIPAAAPLVDAARAADLVPVPSAGLAHAGAIGRWARSAEHQGRAGDREAARGCPPTLAETSPESGA